VAAFWTVNAIACAPAIPRPGPDRQEFVWPTYLGTSQHDASALEKLNPDPRPLWRTDVGHAVRGSPAFGESVVAVGVSDKVVALLDRENGDVFWQQRVAGSVHGGPLLDNDRLYVATEAQPDSKIYALRLRDGRPLWSVPATGIQAPMGFDGRSLYAGADDGMMLKLDAETGMIMWRRRLTGAVRAAPVATPTGIVVATTADSIFLLDSTAGWVRSRASTPGSVMAAPVLAENRLFVATTAGQVLELDLGTLASKWTHNAGDAVLGALALVQDTLFALARDGSLWLIPVNEPERARVLRLDVVSVAGPTPVASGVLVATVAGEILLVDRDIGSILWRARLDGPIEQPPLVVDRQLVVVAGRGDIHAYR
jgi:outer membrane protein assembly factor BamB